MRQANLIQDFDPKRGISVASLAYEYPSTYRISEHAHASDQLIFAIRGVMEVHSGQAVWLIPPSFALWVPAYTPHHIHMPAAVSMRTLYIRPGLIKRREASCVVLSVSAFLRELILESVRIGQLRLKNSEHCNIRDLVALHVARASSIPTEIRMPLDARAFTVANKLLLSLGESPSLKAVCGEVGVSTRTLQRLFMNELGVDATSWRQQARLIRAVEHLIGGSSVKQAAFIVGYHQPSAFVAAFRRIFGLTPKLWVAKVRAT